MTKPWKDRTKLSTKNQKTGRSKQMLFVRDTSIQFPELWINVYVSGPPIDSAGFAEMFARSRCFKANNPDEADLVVFTGGPDVNPSYYSQSKVHSSVYVDDRRDEKDLELYAKCYDDGIPMTGVCRGAQFGHVMNGGSLYMDVDNHQSDHLMYTGDETISVSSVHHQMCKYNEDMDLIGWSEGVSSVRSVSATMVDKGPNKDIEAFFYRDTCFFGVQGHPEYKGYLPFTHWYLSQIEHLIMHNPDVVLDKSKGVYRLKEELRRERDERPSDRIKEIA